MGKITCNLLTCNLPFAEGDKTRQILFQIRLVFFAVINFFGLVYPVDVYRSEVFRDLLLAPGFSCRLEVVGPGDFELVFHASFVLIPVQR